MRRAGRLAAVVLLVAATTGCASLKHEDAGPLHETDALIEYLGAEGVGLMYTGPAVREAFSEPAHTFQVMSGGTLEIIQYENDMSAWMDAPRIDRPMVGAGPHFYHRDNLIVVYSGDDPTVERVLTIVMGSRVA